MNMFIYTPAGDVFSPKSTHERKWITIETGQSPLAQRAEPTGKEILDPLASEAGAKP